MNKDSDDGFIYCNDMQTVSQRPDRTELRPNSVPSKSVSYIFNYFQSSRVSSFPYRSPLICSFGRRRLVYITDRCTCIYTHHVNNQKDDCTVGQSVSVHLSVPLMGMCPWGGHLGLSGLQVCLCLRPIT